MAQVFDLPDTLIHHLLSSWLYVRDIRRLDSALCCRVHRTTYLRIVQSREFAVRPQFRCKTYGWDAFGNDRFLITCDDRDKGELRDITQRFTVWLMKRDISTSILDVHSMWSQNPLDRVSYLQKHGDSVNEISCFGDVNNSTTSLTNLLQHCPNVLAVVGYRTQLVDDSVLETLADGIPRLHVVQLKGCPVTDEGFVTVSKIWSLTSLSVSDCEGVTDTGFRSIAEASPNLNRVHIESDESLWDDLTDATLVALGEHCHRLRSVSIDALNITGTGLMHLAKGCPLLEELRLKGCPDSGDGVVAVARSCPFLRVVTIADTDVPAEAVLAMAERCPLLEKVKLTGDQVGGDEVAVLVARCEKLTHLDVSETAITVHGVRAAALQCTALKFLVISNSHKVDPYERPRCSARKISPTVVCVAFLRAFLNGAPYVAEEAEGGRRERADYW
jgi:hypothetical protein